MNKLLFCFSLLYLLFGQTTGSFAEDQLISDDNTDIYGYMNGSTYINNYFGFEVDLPEDFVIQTKEVRDYTEQAGADLMKNNQLVTDHAMERVYNLLMGTKYPLGTPGKNNPVFQIIVEDIHLFPGISSAGDYLNVAEENLRRSSMVFDYMKKGHTESVNNREYTIMEYGLIIYDIIIYQKWYAFKKDGFVFTVALSYFNNTELKELKKIVRTLRFHADSKV